MSDQGFYDEEPEPGTGTVLDLTPASVKRGGVVRNEAIDPSPAPPPVGAAGEPPTLAAAIMAHAAAIHRLAEAIEQRRS